MEYGIFSLFPSLVAIVLAILTRQVMVSLLAGVFIGKLVLRDGALFVSLTDTLDAIVQVFSEGWTTKTILFSFLVGSIVTLIQASGGVEGFVHYLSEKKTVIRNRRGAMFLGYAVGTFLFIESSISSLVAGTVTRPLSDKYQISREKLAFICDSTSAPVCSLFPLNAWGAVLIGLIAAQISSGTITGNPVAILIESVFYNFYSILILCLVLIIILSGRDFGPMKKAETRALIQGKLLADGAKPLLSDQAANMRTKSGVKPNLINMMLPLGSLLLFMIGSLLVTGNGKITEGSGSTSVYWAVVGTILVCAILYLSQRLMTLSEFIDYVYRGAESMIPVASILIFAFAIGNVANELEAGKYMASLVQSSHLTGGLLPLFVFLIAAVTAFSTGSSWATFAIMMPIAIQMAAGVETNLHACIGAVISGGVMGDHCSPISDTTIVSSMAAACDHVDHVKTQIPYALLAGSIAGMLFLLAGFL